MTDVPILLRTSGMQGDAETSLAEGIDEHLVKPFSPEELYNDPTDRPEYNEIDKKRQG